MSAQSFFEPTGRTPVVDAHVHVGREKYRPLEEYWHDAQECGVDRAFLVQYMGHYDNAYIAGCVRTAPSSFVGIAMVDLAGPDVLADIEKVARDGAFAGIRLEARSRSAGADPYEAWRAIAAAGLAASVRGPLEDILEPSFAEMLEEVPGLALRFEHSAFFRYRHHSAAQLERLMEMSRRPRTYLMWSGYYDFSDEPYPHKDAYPFLQESLAAFGAHRIMWAGDWNRNDLDPQRPEDYYRRAVWHAYDALPFVGDADLAQIMGLSALRYVKESTAFTGASPEGAGPQ